jgi:hypothetical protein
MNEINAWRRGLFFLIGMNKFEKSLKRAKKSKKKKIYERFKKDKEESYLRD